MKPIFVGYTNRTQESDVGKPEQREKSYLTEEDLITHIHGVGATRSGKSKWIEWFCRQLLKQRIGFTLIDPHGALAEALLSYIAYQRFSQPIIYYNPSRQDYLIPFNPFRTGEDEVSKRVAKYVESVLRVWNVQNADQTPRLERGLRDLFHLFATGHISLNEALYLLNWDGDKLRRYAVNLLSHNPIVQADWRQLLSYKRPEDFMNQVESVRNRLFRFAEPPQMRRIMSLEEQSLNFHEITEEGATLIVNLQESEVISEEHARTLGTFMINELWAAVRTRPHPLPRPYFLLIDEVPLFLTPDIKSMLDRGAGKGLHLGLFHQHLTQFKEQDPWTFESVMTNARVKLVFGGLTKQDALMMVDQIFVNQIAYDEVKFVIEQTKFWPVYGRETVYMKSSGGAAGMGSGRADHSNSSAGHSITMLPDPQTGALIFSMYGPITDSTANAQGSLSSSNEFSMQNRSEGEADIPIFYPVPFKEISSMETYSLEEQRNRLAHQLMEQYQRHYFLRKPGQTTLPHVTPFVKTFRIFPKREQEYILERLIKPHAIPVQEIDRLLDERMKKLECEANRPSPSIVEVIDVAPGPIPAAPIDASPVITTPKAPDRSRFRRPRTPSA